MVGEYSDCMERAWMAGGGIKVKRKMMSWYYEWVAMKQVEKETTMKTILAELLLMFSLPYLSMAPLTV